MNPEIFGERQVVFAAVTLIVGLCGWLGGVRLANGWSGIKRVLAYSALLAFFHRFLIFGLAEGRFLSPAGAALSIAIFAALFLFAWRYRTAELMVSQYPWLYERHGLLSWRARGDAPAAPAETAAPPSSRPPPPA